MPKPHKTITDSLLVWFLGSLLVFALAAGLMLLLDVQ